MSDRHPGFTVGNDLAATHGAYSNGRINPRAQEIAEATFSAHPHLDRAKDGPAVNRYSVTAARCERVWAWLAEQPDDTFSDVEAGTVHAALERLTKWESQCDAAEHRLGISPLQRVKLGLATIQAIDAATLLSAAREEADPVLRRAMLERAGLIDRGVGGFASTTPDGTHSSPPSHIANPEKGADDGRC